MLQLRYIGIKYEQFQVPCICICGDTERGVLEVANIALQYYEARGAKRPIFVGFKRNPEGTFNFLLEFGTVGVVDIRGVAASIPERVASGLEFFEGFFILLGFGCNNFSLVDTHTFHILHCEIDVDDRIIRGSKKVRINFSELLEECLSS